MCGIAGYFSPDKLIGKGELEQMTSILSHRGPDAEGMFIEGNTGLGHRRLSIIDLSAGANQPMVSSGKRFIIIYNGEVYNYKDLITQLDVSLSTTGDTEVILEAFAKWRTKSLKMFNGMFAFAVYDREEKSLFLARDRIGIKPLFYSWDGKNLIFASEIKSILKVEAIRQKAEINKQALNEFLYLGYIPEPHTIYSNIKKFPAGHVLKVSNGEFTLEPYWGIEEQIEAKPLREEEKAKEQLKKLLKSSVEYRLVSDVPFGTLLSGGIDSSLVTAVAQELTKEPVNTFSIGFKESQYDESHYARHVAEHLGTRHHAFQVSYHDAVTLVDEMMTAYDEPFGDSSAIPTMLVSKLARQHVTMTLSGDGGDETHLGYGFYNWARRLSNPLVRLGRYPAAGVLSILDNRSRRAAKLFLYRSREKLKSHIFSQEQYYFTENELTKLVDKEYHETVELIENFPKLNRKLDEVEQQALFDLKFYLKDDLLMKVDRASMHYSLENRVPLLDHRLIRLALNIPASLKAKGGESKYLLKQVLYEYLPAKLFDRPKWGFGMPVNIWLKNDLKYLIDDYLNESTIKECGLVDPVIAQKLIKGFLQHKRDYLYNRVWLLIILHKWYFHHFKSLRH